MDENRWTIRVNSELKRALAARNEGNEGRARVCARRAAGWIASEYLRRINHPIQSPSAITLLRKLGEEDISPEILDMVDHFLIHVNPDRQLPIDVDLIAEARQLAIKLLGEDPSDLTTLS